MKKKGNRWMNLGEFGLFFITERDVQRNMPGQSGVKDKGDLINPVTNVNKVGRLRNLNKAQKINKKLNINKRNVNKF